MRLRRILCGVALSAVTLFATAGAATAAPTSVTIDSKGYIFSVGQYVGISGTFTCAPGDYSYVDIFPAVEQLQRRGYYTVGFGYDEGSCDGSGLPQQWFLTVVSDQGGLFKVGQARATVGVCTGSSNEDCLPASRYITLAKPKFF